MSTGRAFSSQKHSLQILSPSAFKRTKLKCPAEPNILPAGNERWAQMNATFAPSCTPRAGHNPTHHTTHRRKKTHSLLVQGVQAGLEGQVLLYLPPGYSQHFPSLPVCKEEQATRHSSVSLHLRSFICQTVGFERRGPRQGPSAGHVIAQKHHCSRATSCPGTRPIYSCLGAPPRALPAVTATLIPSAAALLLSPYSPGP